MPTIDTYSPRKITEQNKDLLPSTHDPKKRTTYVQITLNEAEIKEAIRNYIRAQIPVNSGDELPVRVVAGRGENGHSAEITVSVGEYTVTSPSRPVASMATFEAVADDAVRRNHENIEENPDFGFSSASVNQKKEIKNKTFAEEINEEVSFEAEEEITVTTSPKKSSLFDSATPKTLLQSEAAFSAGSPPEIDETKGVDLLRGEPEAPVEKKRAKSIFDA